MRNDDDRKWLYDTMQSKGVDTGNYDEFCKSLNNKEDRDWYYQKSLEFGLNVGTDKDFTDMMADNTNSPSNGFDNSLKKLRQFAERVGVPNGQSVPTSQAVPTGLPESAQQNDVAQSVSQPVEMPENPNEAYIRASKNTALEKGNNIQQVPSVDYGELSRRAKNDFIDYFYGEKKMGAVGRTENTPNGVRTPYGAVLYDLKAAGEDESTARAIATEALGNFFDKASEQLGTAIINAIPKQSMDREGELNQLWYSRDVQNYIKDLCEKNGVEYDAVVRQKIQPAIRNAYKQKYGVDTNFNAFSGADRAEDQVRTYEANKVVAPYLGKMVDDAFAVFDKKGAEAYRKTRSENEESSMFVNPEQQGGHILAGIFGAERAKIKASDPGKVREHLEQRVEQLYGDLVKNKNFQKDAIAKAEELGIPVMEYIQSYVLPGFADNLQKKFRETAVAREMPDSDLENILQGITRDSIFGMLFNKLLYSDEQREYQQEAMAKSDRGMWSNVGRMTAGMAADFWLWLASGGIGAKAAQGIIKQRVASVAAKEGISEAAARVVVENEMKKFWTKNMIKNITPRLASSAVTLGGAEATTTAIRGITNEDNVIDVIADTAASAASGGTTGLAFGLTGGMVHPLVGRLTGIPKLFGIIGAYEVEAGTMYATGEMHKLLAGEAAFENPLEGMLESNVSLGGIKLAQPLALSKFFRSLWHPIRTTREAMQPSKEGYFTEDDIKSLESKTESRNLLEVVKKLGSGEAVVREDVAEAATAYDTYMRDKDEPVSRKAKVANLFGKKAPVVGYEVSMEHFFDEDDNYIIRTRDMDGQCVNEYKFKNVEDGEAKETELKNTLYNNEVEALAERVNLWNGQRDLLSWQPQDEEMQRKVLTLNQHAEELVSIAEKQSSNEPLTPDEQKLLNTYWDALAGYVRDGGAYKTFERNYEKQKGLQEGTLEKILKKPSKDYSADERMVVDEYKEALRSELPERKGEDVEDVAVVQQQTGRGQAERGQEEQGLTVENERQVLIDEGRQALLSADSEALRQIDMDVDLAAERVRRLQEQEHPDAEALAAAQEMLSLAEARAYGVRTGLQVLIESQQRAIVEELEPMKSESGMITPVTLHDGRQGFVKAGAIDLDNHYGSLFVTFEKDGEWTTEQVGNNLIREVGESRSFDDMVSERSRAMEEETIARIQRISEGLDVEPGRQVMLTIGDVTAPFEVRGESNGQVVLRDANGEEVAMPRADVENYIKTTRAKEVAERLNIENPTEAETPTLPEGEGVKEITPVGKGIFGDIYDQFNGKVYEAFNFLIKNKGGDILSVWNRNDVGDIDLVWGDRTTNDGLDHIIFKHVGEGKDFANEQEMMETIDDIIKNGTINESRSKWDKVVLEKDGRFVVIRKNVRDNQGTIIANNKNWVVTSFDNNVPKSKKNTSAVTRATPDNNEGGRAVTPDVSSEGKDNVNLSSVQENGEKIVENPQNISTEEVAAGSKTAADIFDEIREGYEREKQERLGYINAAKSSNERLRRAEKVYGSDSLTDGIIRDMEPRDAHELAASELRPHSIEWTSLNKELGGMRGGFGHNTDMGSFAYYIGKKDDMPLVGVPPRVRSFNDIVHEIWESRPDHLREISDQDVRNALLDILMSAQKPSDIIQYVLNNRIQEAESALEGIHRSEENAAYEGFIEEFHETPETYRKIIEIDEKEFSSIPEENFTKINSIFAEKYLEEDGQRKESGTPGSLQGMVSTTPSESKEVRGDTTGGREEVSPSITEVHRRHSSHGEEAQRAEGKNESEDSGILPDEGVYGAVDSGTSGGEVEVRSGSFADRLSSAIAETETNPSEGQKKSGNYKKGHLSFGGYDFTIENPKGSVRRGVDATGKSWEQTMNNTYGYLRGKGMLGKDGDHLDVFINDGVDLDTFEGPIFIIDQVNKDGSFDEHKIMYGFDDMPSAIRNYLMNYERPWEGLGNITEVDKATFDKWLESSDRKLKPFAETRFGDSRDVVSKIMDIGKNPTPNEEPTEGEPTLNPSQREGLGGESEGEEVKGDSGVKPKERIDADGGGAASVVQSSAAKIEDFGEKIGMARKDTSVKGIKKGTGTGEPAWKKKYTLHNLANPDGGAQRMVDLNGLVIGDTDYSKPFIAYYTKKAKSRWGYDRHYPIRDKDGNVMVFRSREEFDSVVPVWEVREQMYRIREKDGKFVITRTASNGKAVEYASFDTREEAEAYMTSPEGATSLLNHKRENFELPALESLTRNGMKDYRQGRNVSGQDMLDTFGFRGGEFGNWVNADERQQFLNTAYDALMDLANLVGVSPRALSLNGELSIAFGARGSKGAKAHYEPSRAVINLTKMNGAGSLAHEWAHALDNYFGMLAKGVQREHGGDNSHYVSEYVWSSDPKIRKEVLDIFKEIQDAMKRKTVTRDIDIAHATDAEKTLRTSLDKAIADARAEFERGVTKYVYNRKTRKRETQKIVPTEEQLQRFDELMKSLEKDVRWYYVPEKDGYRMLGESADALYELMKDVLPNKKGKYGPAHNVGYYISRWKEANDYLERAKNGERETVAIDTKFYGDSKRADAGRAGSYFSTDKELLARAFETYLADKMMESGKSSDYLTYKKGDIFEQLFGINVYPATEEADRLSGLFDKLFSTIEERVVEDTGNVALYEKVGERRPLTEREVVKRDALIDDMKEHRVDIIADEASEKLVDEVNGVRLHKVYHGSGADFDAFDHSHMGEGEGAQAYGYGTYVTEIEGIGKTYAKEATSRKQRSQTPIVYWKGQRIDFSDANPLRMAFDVVESERTIHEARQRAERLLGLVDAEDTEMKGKWQEVVEILRNSNKSDFKRAPVKENRMLYTVEIPDDNGHNYLDWTKKPGIRDINRLIKQMDDKQKERISSIPVQKYANGYEIISKDDLAKRILWHINNSGWNNLYDVAEIATGGKYVGNEKYTAKLLRSAGFVGIKYPAEHRSGGRKDGAKNYVIFDESDLTITDKLRFFRTPNGEAYGFTLNGVIHIDPRIATSETPIHEYSHLWVDAMRKSNPEEWESIKKMLRAERAGKLGEIWRQVSENYPELEGNDDALCEEILTHYSGKRGAERLEAEVRRVADSDASPLEKSTVIAGLRRLGEGIRRFWKWVADSFHIHYKDVDEVADRIMSDLAEGRNFKDVKEKESPVFYSNAERAVEGISQEKATPEQWLKMIEKGGGLKAAEDKWLGLGDWLREKQTSQKTLTKKEVLDFIKSNRIEVEEVKYEEYVDADVYNNPRMMEYQKKFDDLVSKYKSEKPHQDEEDARELAFRDMVDEYGDDFEMAFEVNWGNGKLEPTMDMYGDNISDAAKYYLDFNIQPINSTRLAYTTEGLDNKREIALTVPSVESYNEGDQIHFGDAGGGRAVAWARFGDATNPHITTIVKHIDKLQEPREISRYLLYYPEGANAGWSRDYIVYGKIRTGEMKYVPTVNEKNISAHDTLEEALDAMNEYYKAHPISKKVNERVLVIDEIQSKRHQDGREKGYRTAEAVAEEERLGDAVNKAQEAYDAYTRKMGDKYDGAYEDIYAEMTDAERAEADRLEQEVYVTSEQLQNHDVSHIPEAPFEKNWHELAMKRMLRYAAENGYDKIAWTKGAQQAERYNIGNVVDKIISYDYPAVRDTDGRETKKVEIRLTNGDTMTMRVDREGKVIEGRSDTTGQQLSDIVGKDLALRIMSGEGKDGTIFDADRDLPAKVIEEDDLRIGGEGMKGFYDQMLPRFMDKYGKKWGVKTGEVFLSELGDNGITMWSVDVTPEMRKSVMEGQPMFMKKSQDEKTLMGVHNISEEKLKKALKTGRLANPSLAVIDTKQGMHNDYGAISLIPKSTLIDKRTGRNAGTYSGDAWTPTYPHVERRLTAEGEKHLEELSKAAGGGNKEIENHIWSNLISYIEDNSDRLHFLFLQQKGLNPEIKQQQITHSHEEYEELRKLLGDDFRNIRELTKEQNDALLEIMMKPFEEESKASVADIQEAEKREQTYNILLKMYREKLVDENGKLFFAKWNTYLDNVARDEYRRNNPKIDWRDTDYDASKRVNEEGLSEEYAQWKETLLNDNDISEVLFAGFTPSGTRKYLPNTAENASRLMNKQSDTNSYGNGGFGATRSQLLQKFSSLKDIRKNKDLIQNDETAAERAKELSDELFDIISQISDLQKISDNQFMNTDYAESRLQEAITKKDPVDYLNKEYGYHIPQDGELASQIKDFIEATQKLPAKYFETKFKRPVGLDEFAIAVVPENTSQEVVKALKDAGLDVRTYDDSDYQTADENRRQVTMDAVNGRDDIRFRRGEEFVNFHSVIDEMFNNADFDKSSHLRERYDLGTTPEWMKGIGISGERFTLSFKNIKTHIGKDADHNLTAKEWHELPSALQNPFAITKYNGEQDRFRMYVNIIHNGNYVAVGVDVKRINKGRGVPMLEVNSIKTVFAHHGEIGGKEELIAWDKNITPEQEALLRGLNYHEYPTIQELSAANINNNIEKTKLSDKKYRLNNEDRSAAVEAARGVGEQLGGIGVEVVLNGEATDADKTLTEEQRVSKGWYDPSTGKVYLNASRIESAEDAVRTVLHEKAGHEGLSALLGGQEGVDRWGDFIFKSADKELRRRMVERADAEGYSMADRLRWSKAAQEVFADIAMEGPKTAEEFSLWRKAKHYIIKALKALGIRVRGMVTDEDLRYYVMKTVDALRKGGKKPTLNPSQREGLETGSEDLRFNRMPGTPARMEGESDARYFARLREWEQRKLAEEQARSLNDAAPDMTTFEKKYDEEYRRAKEAWDSQVASGVTPEGREPDPFDYMKKANDAYREAYKSWQERQYDADEMDADLALYGSATGREEVRQSAKDVTSGPHGEDIEQKMLHDIGEALGADMSVKGVERAVKLSVIERRKNLESASAEDAIYIHDLEKEAAAVAKEHHVESKELLDAIPLLIELPRRLKEIADGINNTLTWKTRGFRPLTEKDIENMSSLLNRVPVELPVSREHAPELTPELRSWQRDVADVINAGNGPNDRLVTADDIQSAFPSFARKTTGDIPANVLAIADRPAVRNLISKVNDWYAYFYHWLDSFGMRKDDVGYINDYVNHIWDKEKSDPQAYEQYVENYQRMSSPNMRKREIMTYQEGIDLGLVPKFSSITDMMRYYSRSNNEAVSNKQFVAELSGVMVNEKNSKGEVTATVPLMSSKEPSFTLDKYEYFQVPGIGGLWVYKPAASRFSNIFGPLNASGDKSWTKDAWRKYDTAASTAKKIELSFSGFHAGALTEVYLAQNLVRFGPWKSFKNLYKYLIGDTIKTGSLPAYANAEDFRDAAAHLVKLGATDDYAAANVRAITSRMREMLADTQRQLSERGVIGKVGSAAISPLRVVSTLLDWANKGMDTLLWDYLHDGLKIATYKMYRDSIMSQAPKKGWNQEKIDMMLDEVGQYVNDMFGGQYWELINVNPKLLKGLQRCFLSPDWLVSTQRHFFALGGFGSLYNEGGFINYLKYNRDNLKRFVGYKDIAKNDFRAFRSMNAKLCYGIGVMIGYNVVMNAINALIRRLDEEGAKEEADEIRKTNPNYKSRYELAYPDGMKWFDKAHPLRLFGDYGMGGNAAGQQSHLFTGHFNDGSEIYLRWGKQFREFPELWMNHKGEFEFPGPLVQRMLGKANPIARTIYEDLLYLNEFTAGYRDKQLQEKYGKFVGLLAKTAKNFLPFTVPTQEDKEFIVTDLFFPSGKGFSKWKAKTYFETFAKSGDMDGIALTYKSCVLNGLDAEQLLDASLKNLDAMQKKELGDGVKDLQGACERFDGSQNLDEKRKMKNKIDKYISSETYKDYSRAEALEKVRRWQSGEDVKQSTKVADMYLEACNSGDILEDYRVREIKRKSSVYKKNLRDMENNDATAEELQSYERQYQRWFDIVEMLDEYDSDIRDMKSELPDGNRRQVMNAIRDRRKTLLKELEKVSDRVF